MSESSTIYATNGTSGNATVPLQESGNYVAELEERLAALEWALDDPQWRRLSATAVQEFSRGGLRDITDLCRIMFVKNPVIKRGVSVKRFYVFGQGWTIRAQDADIQATLDAFLYDSKNDDVLGGHEARMQLEIELETDGNLFFAFFINRITGRIRVRRIDFDQIDDILFNPDDGKDPWYYKRVWTESRTNFASGAVESEQRTAYYPDWRHTPTAKPATIGGHPIHWDSPVYHVRVGGFSNWKFGISEIYDAIDWAAAYKNFLEDWASIVRAYRRFAFQLTTPNARSVAPAKARLGGVGMGDTYSAAGVSPITGSTFIASEGHTLEPVRTSGATVSAEDGRRLLLMVAASFGLPETFFGDASVGTLATAKSLDRPTELQLLDRQQLWRDVTLNILGYVQLWAVKAPQGALRGLGRIVDELEDNQHNERVAYNEGVEDDVSVEFPPLLEHDIPAMVTSIVQAATLGGAGVPAGTIDLPTLSRILLNTLGVSDADEIVQRLFPNGEIPEPETPGESIMPQAESLMIDAVKELRHAIRESTARA